MSAWRRRCQDGARAGNAIASLRWEARGGFGAASAVTRKGSPILTTRIGQLPIGWTTTTIVFTCNRLYIFLKKMNCDCDCGCIVRLAAHANRSTKGEGPAARARIMRYSTHRRTNHLGSAGHCRARSWRPAAVLLLWAGRARAPIDELARGRGWYLVFQRDTSRGDRVEGGGG